MKDHMEKKIKPNKLEQVVDTVVGTVWKYRQNLKEFMTKSSLGNPGQTTSVY